MFTSQLFGQYSYLRQVYRNVEFYDKRWENCIKCCNSILKNKFHNTNLEARIQIKKRVAQPRVIFE
jgi:hypothetical protein